MRFSIEYFRTLHYFYFYLAASAAFTAFLAWSDFQKKSIILIIMALACAYYSYRTELKVKELIVESRPHQILSRTLIICLAAAYQMIFISQNLFFASIDSTLIIITYIAIFTALILILSRFNFTDNIKMYFGISKAHLGRRKAIALKNETHPQFEEVLGLVDTNVLKSYTIGTSKQIDKALSDIADSQTQDSLLWNIRFLFIYLYELKLDTTSDNEKIEKFKKAITALKKQL